MADSLALDEFVKLYDIETEEGIMRMVCQGVLTNANDCCGTMMTLVLKRKKWTWQCRSCASTKSILRQSFFEVRFSSECQIYVNKNAIFIYFNNSN